MAKKNEKKEKKEAEVQELTGLELQDRMMQLEDELSREELDAYDDIFCMDNFFETRAEFFRTATPKEVEEKFPGFDGKLTENVIKVLFIAKSWDEAFEDAISEYDDLDD